MVNTNNDYGNLSLDGNYYMQPTTKDADPDNLFQYAQAIKTTKDDNLVAEFTDARGVDLTVILSPDKKFLASYQGLFNAQNDLLIAFDLNTIDTPEIFLSFSKDSKFIKISYAVLQRVFALDPKFIINRLNRC